MWWCWTASPALGAARRLRPQTGAQYAVGPDGGGNLGRVDDPAAGSWYLDARTHDLALAGWTEFQVIEAEGGVVEALKGGVIQPRIARARQVREAALANGSAQIIGVTKYVDADVRAAPVEGADVAAASA